MTVREIDNKINISNSKINLIYHINTPPDPTRTNILSIADSDANIHLAIHTTPTMSPVIMDNEMKSRLPDGSTMESTHITTPQLPGISRIVDNTENPLCYHRKQVSDTE